MKNGRTTTKTQTKYRCLYCCPLDRRSRARVVAAGSFRRACDRRIIKRYKCFDCLRSFSDATVTFEYRQKRRDINLRLFELLSSCVSLRRSAKLVRTHRATVDRRLAYFAKVAGHRQEVFLRKRAKSSHIQFDDMESSEHTKLKPLSIPLAVDGESRLILAFDVVSMPAKGPMAEVSRKKYGRRLDHRKKGWNEVLGRASRTARAGVRITTDSHLSYPAMIKAHMPDCIHIREKSRKAAVVGQGELKEGAHDPLFSLNHTAAMLRANINRLVRKTWCTTKRQERLKMHIATYTLWHNETILAKELKRPVRFPFT